MSDDTTNSTGPDTTSQDTAQTPVPALPVLSYATPDQFRSELLRDGRYIVLPHGMDLPDRCIRCGEPADVRIAVSFNLVVPLRKINIHVGMCHTGFRAYRIPRLVLGCIFAAAGLAVCAVMSAKWLVERDGTLLELAARQFPGVTLLAVAVALLLVKTPRVWCQKANATAAWIGGAREPFLRQLSPVERGKKSILDRDISELL